MKKNLLKELKRRVLVIDGAMGTLLMEGGVKPEDNFDLQNLKNPELVKSIHKSYIDAGADIIETNSFGANRLKLPSEKVKEVNQAAVRIAREAAGDKAFVFGSVGPLGKLLKPHGEVSFDQAYNVFAEQIKALAEASADAICIETISDIQEMRAALLAAKDNVKIPIICSMTYEKDGKTIFGTPIEAAAVTLESLGADVISLNCSTGPKDMQKVAKRLRKTTSIPIMVMPNAGMPELVDGKAIYKMTPEIFAKQAVEFAKLGVSIVGGCCGTTPQHIRAVKSKIGKDRFQTCPNMPQNPKLSSRTKVIEIEKGKLLVVGERINPTGRKALREEIKSGVFHTVREEAIAQTKAKADLLDINISIPMGDDAGIMKKAVDTVQQATDLPLSIDSPNILALESGLKEFAGCALLNSVNGKKESLNKILPLAKRFGCLLIGLCLDDKGIPKTVAEKVAIAKKIIEEAAKVGIPKENILIDTLVMTAAVSVDEALETLKAIPEVKKLGVKTILGVSNCSHGLPSRSKVNAIYLELARLYGLDAAIIDPIEPEIHKAIGKPATERRGFRDSLLKQLKDEVQKSFKLPKTGKIQLKKREIKPDLPTIRQTVIDGDQELTQSLVQEALKSIDPQKIISNALISGMEVVGKRFSKKEIYLPQVLVSAEAMKKGFTLCKAKIPKGEIKTIGKIALATVQGDVHDIGKNIVKMMLENHGFSVIDMGMDVKTEKIIEIAKAEKPAAIALSALLTTTMLEMKAVKEELKKIGLNIPVIIGGAVVTSDFAKDIDALHGQDAAEAVTLAKKIITLANP
ncbi:MAG: homocysteine S-methyltransferase family protein [Candidatus Saganbacteria bacterium]|nr:homocysteine S-methyltransferase family protein [Candidatus Saganbacteria bacterium]